MVLQFTTSYIEDSLAVFRYYKKLAERAMEQVTDEQLFEVLDCEANSIADHRETYDGQYAIALDRFPRPPTEKSQTGTAMASSCRSAGDACRSAGGVGGWLEPLVWRD
jgi:hypothetical protein